MFTGAHNYLVHFWYVLDSQQSSEKIVLYGYFVYAHHISLFPGPPPRQNGPPQGPPPPGMPPNGPPPRQSGPPPGMGVSREKHMFNPFMLESSPINWCPLGTFDHNLRIKNDSTKNEGDLLVVFLLTFPLQIFSELHCRLITPLWFHLV